MPHTCGAGARRLAPPATPLELAKVCDHVEKDAALFRVRSRWRHTMNALTPRSCDGTNPTTGNVHGQAGCRRTASRRGAGLRVDRLEGGRMVRLLSGTRTSVLGLVCVLMLAVGPPAAQGDTGTHPR